MSTGAAEARSPPVQGKRAGLLLARAESDGILAEERGVPEGPASTAKRASSEVGRGSSRGLAGTGCFPPVGRKYLRLLLDEIVVDGKK